MSIYSSQIHYVLNVQRHPFILSLSLSLSLSGSCYTVQKSKTVLADSVLKQDPNAHKWLKNKQQQNYIYIYKKE